MKFSPNLGDEALSAECAECQALYADYVEACDALEQAEIARAPEARIDELRQWAAASRQTWRAAVRRTMGKSARTSGGLIAKVPILKGLLLDTCAENEDVFPALLDYLGEVERLLREERSPRALAYSASGAG